MVEGFPSRALERFRRLTGQASRPALDRYLAATLREAFAVPGCPLCRLLEEKERRLLPALLWEHVNDPITAEQLAVSRGFCWEHTWALVPAGAAVHSHLGVAILLERILRDVFRSCPDRAALDRWLRPRAACLVCAWLASAEDGLLATAAELTRQHPALLRDAPALLCQQHATALGGLLPDFPWSTWQARVGRERHARSRLEALANEVGRRPWYLPRPALLPALCPSCLAERPGRGRLWAWLHVFWQSPSPDIPLEPCLGHAATADHPDWRHQLAALLDDLAVFVAAHDYRFHGTLTAAQRASWLRAVVRLVGVVPAAGAHERWSTGTV
ncbi:hypothetical protein OO015_11515 [Thermomicrobium sp. 4228-Ro]|uniref:hypothetical protein n=1 Tax=Thermomicrobium sp. 4228-Ro TaxID=2993937 RepID=UPI002248A2CD|nr:hypothetical protein [Thermomicrobium sp. 4228-Ro]MCX2728118.1 hypothetical protein [Thermomicrobium sp. 4228-Ro]